MFVGELVSQIHAIKRFKKTMRQLVAIRALNVNHPNKPKMQRYQSRHGLLTLTKWIISQLIICLPACSKLTVTFMPTIDCTWPAPQSGWFGCTTKSPRLKYNICLSHAGRLCCPRLSLTMRNCICKDYVPQHRSQGNVWMGYSTGQLWTQREWLGFFVFSWCISRI